MGCGASKATADKTNDPPPERVKLHEDASAGKSTGPSPTKSAAAAADAVDAPPKSVVFIFGHDLSNKSSICKQLSDEFGCQYLQPTELLLYATRWSPGDYVYIKNLESSILIIGMKKVLPPSLAQ